MGLINRSATLRLGWHEFGPLIDAARGEVHPYQVLHRRNLSMWLIGPVLITGSMVGNVDAYYVEYI